MKVVVKNEGPVAPKMTLYGVRFKIDVDCDPCWVGVITDLEKSDGIDLQLRLTLNLAGEDREIQAISKLPFSAVSAACLFNFTGFEDCMPLESVLSSAIDYALSALGTLEFRCDEERVDGPAVIVTFEFRGRYVEFVIEGDDFDLFFERIEDDTVDFDPAAGTLTAR